MREDPHPSNQELLLAADGELSSRQAARLRAHLSACWHCRTRMAQMESSITEFTQAYRGADDCCPPVEGPRALLKARIAEAAHSAQGRPRWDLHYRIPALALLVIALGGVLGFEFRARYMSNSRPFEARATPRFSLTPGAVRSVTRNQVCSTDHAAEIRLVPASLKRQVFEEYGMPQGKADAFEVDYLVTPELGGAQDIRNLWPQPYSSTVWNAHVKDALEERLHNMVCSGQIDLATAQHDIANDWISAYKKYFHTDNPF